MVAPADFPGSSPVSVTRVTPDVAPATVPQQEQRSELRHRFRRGTPDRQLRAFCGSSTARPAVLPKHLQIYAQTPPKWLRKVQEADIRAFATTELGLDRLPNPREREAIRYVLAARRNLDSLEGGLTYRLSHNQLQLFKSDANLINFGLLKNNHEPNLASLPALSDFVHGGQDGSEGDPLRREPPLGKEIKEKFEIIQHQLETRLYAVYDKIDLRQAQLDPRTDASLAIAYPDGHTQARDQALDYAVALWKLEHASKVFDRYYKDYTDSDFKRDLYHRMNRDHVLTDFERASENWQKALSGLNDAEKAAFATQTRAVEEMQIRNSSIINTLKWLLPTVDDYHKMQKEKQAAQRKKAWDRELDTPRFFAKTMELNPNSPYPGEKFIDNPYTLEDGSSMRVRQYGQSLQKQVESLVNEMQSLAERIALYRGLPEAERSPGGLAALQKDVRELRASYFQFSDQMSSFQDKNAGAYNQSGKLSARYSMYETLPSDFKSYIDSSTEALRKFLVQHCLEPVGIQLHE